MSLEVSLHLLGTLDAPLCRDVPSIRWLLCKELGEVLNLLWWCLNCEDKVIVIFHVILVFRPDVMEWIEHLSLRVHLVPSQIVSIECCLWILLWLSSEDHSLGNHVTCSSILSLVSNDCSPDPIYITCSIHRSLIPYEVLSIVECNWLKGVVASLASSCSRNFCSTQVDKLPEFLNEHQTRLLIEILSKFIHILSAELVQECKPLAFLHIKVKLAANSIQPFLIVQNLRVISSP